MNNIRSISSDHEKLIKILHEEECIYTNKGRLNKSSLCRLMDKKSKEIDDLLYDCQRELLK